MDSFNQENNGVPPPWNNHISANFASYPPLSYYAPTEQLPYALPPLPPPQSVWDPKRKCWVVYKPQWTQELVYPVSTSKQTSKNTSSKMQSRFSDCNKFVMCKCCHPKQLPFEDREMAKERLFLNHCGYFEQEPILLADGNYKMSDGTLQHNYHC
jgi:hypothetical protein